MAQEQLAEIGTKELRHCDVNLCI